MEAKSTNPRMTTQRRGGWVRPRTWTAPAPRVKFGRKVAGLVLLMGLGGLTGFAADPAGPATPPLYALLVGGGPDRDSNAAQIEGHVRFVGQLLPEAAKHALLFADGKADSASVSYLNLETIPVEKRAMAVLLPENGFEPKPPVRVADLGLKLDGPARLPDFRRAIGRLATQLAAKPAPLLLFFAGHGTQNEEKEAETQYDLWDGEALSVRELAAELARLPAQAPTVLVMAQCFSGAFANVLCKGGEPDGPFVNRDLAGFFSARKDRTASGCSLQTTAADYQDFSSYFFGALCGHDRFGHAIESADFAGDGKVTLHEAFCYALIHDASNDTPVCTSDLFLQRFAPLPPAEIYMQPYAKILQAATPAQRAALEALSLQLHLSGEQRPLAVFDRLNFSDPIANNALIKADNDASEALNTLRQDTLQTFFKQWPLLRWTETDGYADAAVTATSELARNKDLAGRLLAADKAYQDAEDAVDNDEAALLRFAGLCENVVQAQHLREHGTEETKREFERLWQAEQGTLPLRAR